MAINELAVVGYWFYGAGDADERASLMASWGLLDDVPAAAEPPPIIEGLMTLGLSLALE